MPYTNDDTVQTLCKSILTRLENQNVIEFSAEKRAELQQAIYQILKPSIMTEEDLREKTLKEMGAASEELESMDLAESTQFRTARAMIRRQIGDNELNGMFFQLTLKEIGQNIAKFFMESPLIEEVYEDDHEIEKRIVEIVHKFNPGNMS